jgi:outer membrane receptor protein involved in Fe transport
MEAFVTTGSNIKRLDQETTLPVTVFSMAQLETRDSSTPADLLIGIPEITNIPANETSTNAVAARGDNANVALRGLGTLNTLILLNGRRMPVHPLTSSAVNVNTLPTFGLQQVEVLRDGASAIYGSDAVAGVVNYVTAKKPQGSQIQNRFMFTQHGGGMEDGLNIGYGRMFAEGKGSYTMSLTAFHRDAIYLREREFSSNTNRLKYARAPWNVVGQSAWDGSTAIGRWAQFIPGASTSNTATRWFYPTSGVASDTPSINTVATPRSLYENYNDYVTGQPRSWRTNLYNRVDYDFTPTIHGYFDSSFYLSRSFTGRQPITLNSTDSRVFLGIDNPYNPFGSRFYSATGAPNSDGTARLTGAPQQTTMTGVFLTDGGPEKLTALDSAWRMLAGVSGSFGKSSWKWDAAVMTGSVYATDQAKNAVRDSYLARRRVALGFHRVEPLRLHVQGFGWLGGGRQALHQSGKRAEVLHGFGESLRSQ